MANSTEKLSMKKLAEWSMKELQAERSRIERDRALVDRAIDVARGNEMKALRAEVAALSQPKGTSDSSSTKRTTKPVRASKGAGSDAPGKKNVVGASTRKASAGATRSSAARYRAKHDSSLTWSGNGRRPAWVVEFEQAGGSRDELLIKGSR